MPEDDPRPSEALVPTGDERVLIVDDEEELRDVAGGMLRHLGYEVTCSTSGRSALAMIEESPHDFDVILTDQTMPGMTGESLVRRIHAIRSELPVILWTGFSEGLDSERATELGFADHLTKPVDLRTLATTIRRAIKG